MMEFIESYVNVFVTYNDFSWLLKDLEHATLTFKVLFRIWGGGHQLIPSSLMSRAPTLPYILKKGNIKAISSGDLLA